jgi:hypothetical protein
MPFSIKRLLIGNPIATEFAHEARLPIWMALPIFASDALSSTAYATEEIMAALLLGGVYSTEGFFTFGLTPLLSLAIVVLLAIVITSYRQTLFAYPHGGAAYVVARENLGTFPAQAAGAALLMDYILTVAVSTAAGIAAINSLVLNYNLNLFPYTVPMCLVAVAFLAVMNLRGVKESGFAFALPTYIFMGIMGSHGRRAYSRSRPGYLAGRPRGDSRCQPSCRGVTSTRLIPGFASIRLWLYGLDWCGNDQCRGHGF